MDKNLKLLSKFKSIEQDEIKYSLNLEQKTANVIKSNSNKDNLIIPTSIIYEFIEYNVTSILEDSFEYSDIKSIQFPPNSKLQTIEKKAF